jgi:hypothetical protein
MNIILNDNQALHGAVWTGSYGYRIRTYDDTFGPLWLYRTADYLTALVRAQSLETAYEIVEDDILVPIDADDVVEAYGFYVTSNRHDYPKPDKAVWYAKRDTNFHPDPMSVEFPTERQAIDYCLERTQEEECDLVEGYSYQSNATGTGIVSHCLDGEYLETPTREQLRELGICLILETDD